MGANYVWLDGHAKWMNAKVVYPHPAYPTPAPASTAVDPVVGAAWCAAAKYFANRDIDRQTRLSRAIARGMPTCTLD
jgi:prepilin-type processing-associated H-X9-DG protein